MKAAGLHHPERNFWFGVYDFSDPAKTGTNWSIVDPKAEEPLWTPLGIDDHLKNCCPRIEAGSIPLPSAEGREFGTNEKIPITPKPNGRDAIASNQGAASLQLRYPPGPDDDEKGKKHSHDLAMDREGEQELYKKIINKEKQIAAEEQWESFLYRTREFVKASMTHIVTLVRRVTVGTRATATMLVQRVAQMLKPPSLPQ